MDKPSFRACVVEILTAFLILTGSYEPMAELCALCTRTKRILKKS